MKLAVIYHSVTGNTKKAAEFVKAGMEKAEGVTAECYSVDDVKPEDFKDAAGIAFGAPTYYADMSWQMLKFLEGRESVLTDKLGCAFSTANVPQGGSELVLQNINNVMLANGMIVYTGGAVNGMPKTHIGANAFVQGANVEDRADVFEALGERFAKKAVELFG